MRRWERSTLALAGLRGGSTLSLCIGPSIGAFIAQGVMHATGFDRGWWLAAMGSSASSSAS